MSCWTFVLLLKWKQTHVWSRFSFTRWSLSVLCSLPGRAPGWARRQPLQRLSLPECAHSPWKDVTIWHTHPFTGASLLAQRLKRLPAMRETRVRSLGWEDPLEKEMATHSSILAWRIPWTEQPSRLQSMGSQRVGHDWATSHTPFNSSTTGLKAFWNRPLECRSKLIRKRDSGEIQSWVRALPPQQLTTGLRVSASSWCEDCLRPGSQQLASWRYESSGLEDQPGGAGFDL